MLLYLVKSVVKVKLMFALGMTITIYVDVLAKMPAKYSFIKAKKYIKSLSICVIFFIFSVNCLMFLKTKWIYFRSNNARDVFSYFSYCTTKDFFHLF